MTTKQILEKARGMISKREHWTTGVLRDSMGHSLRCRCRP